MIRMEVDVTEGQFQYLSALAHARGYTEADEVVASLVRSLCRVPLDSDDVVLMVIAGFTDSSIGARLNLTNMQVAVRRRRAGLPANRRFRSVVGV